MAERRFYWLKLPETFFRDKQIKRLRRVAGGDTFTIIYLKMLLASMQDGGKLYFDGLEETVAEEVALEIDEDADNVKLTLNFLVNAGLAEIGSDGVMLPALPEMIGTETSAAIRKRRSREMAQLALKCDNVTPESQPSHDEVTNGHTEKEIDKEKEIEKDIYPVADVIEYLNSKANTRYRATSRSNRGHILARFREGFTLDDFRTVIDKKCAEWIGGDMEKFLRPETLFGSKFEGYLNANIKTGKKNGFANYQQRSTDYDALLERMGI